MSTIPAWTPVAEAARRMRDEDSVAVLVADDDGRFVGLVSERDIVRKLVADALDARRTRIDAVMNTRLDRLEPHDLAVDALDLMEIRDIDCLPVFQGEQLLGLVTLVDLCEAMRREIEEAIHEDHESVFSSEHRT